MANRSHGKIDKLRPEVKSEVESMITSYNRFQGNIKSTPINLCYAKGQTAEVKS